MISEIEKAVGGRVELGNHARADTFMEPVTSKDQERGYGGGGQQNNGPEGRPDRNSFQLPHGDGYLNT